MGLVLWLTSLLGESKKTPLRRGFSAPVDNINRAEYSRYMTYTTNTYKFKGSNDLADEVAYLATKNDLRVEARITTGIFTKEHLFVVFGPADGMSRFEREMNQAKNSIR
jgi:hypothetical protein